MANNDNRRRPRNGEFEDAVGQVRSILVVIGIFSLVINLLMLASPLYMLQVYDRVLVTGRTETLILLTVVVGGAMLILGLIDGLRSMIMVRMACWLTDRLSPGLIASGVRARLAGDTAGAQPLRDLIQVQHFLSSQGLAALFDAPWTPIFLALVWLLHPTLGIFATVAALVLVALGLTNELLTRRATQSANTAQLIALQQAEATIRNAEVVRAMGMLPNLLERWRAGNEVVTRDTLSSSHLSAFILGITKAVRFFVQSATLGLGAYLVLRGEASGGVMIASSILLGRALAPIELVMGGWRSLTATRIAYGRLRSRMQSVPAEPARTRLPEPYGHVTLDKVSYMAPGKKEPIVDNVSIRLRPGEAVAVIGPSAGGKSTLCRLIAGTASPSSGVIRLDGSELHHWDSIQLGQYFGYLPQDVELFAGSVRDNIGRMGEASDEAIVRAAILAQAHDMIQKLPQGYDTSIGESGMRLSGGQRQRIGLARAVFGDPKLVVLDEPNANLDQAGEAALAAAVQELKARGTALMIVGHRPSTLAQADKVLFLRDGRVELFGPREDVLARLRVAASEAQRNPERGDQAAQLDASPVPRMPSTAQLSIEPGEPRHAGGNGAL
ncbi:type I secretion system permease/ATPase [Mesorhizobium sp. CAU 1741]|uniref:type I secretion system permease/ATPase n=1 Tax=Mesorhizobium sp. CAU 1741 TaxID=3140366 RepID=UPI00325BBB0C